ncbi:type II toxin-antitoxin system HipA family toxin [Pantoea trifolii]|uniref:type II toxin-antitoxin system HipA family toxin n=1 Tax=Candidatus Pantoea symbiotica TaxID=1884370 RepID=UPI00077BCC78|nr:HipA domain-containing protein [Pantoea rodasii]
MTSEARLRDAYVWIWLPGETSPVVAGRLEAEGDTLFFNYGRSYLQRENCIPLNPNELPLNTGVISPLNGLTIAGCIRDSAPDAWGRRVIINRRMGRKGANVDTGILDELTYLIESGSDRIGALDFQHSATEYVPRSAANVTLPELLESADRVEKGVPLTPELDQALFHGTSIGGARPKALIEAEGKKYIAKFSASTDIWNVVKGEFLAMRLAQLAGLHVAPVKLVKAAGRDVIMIERFDREQKADGWTRKVMLSALTLFELDDMLARYASYETLAEIIRQRFASPKETLLELYKRLCFNILCGNTDDHARNHAAFWDGKSFSLTPAYDICPQGRAGNEASQAMLISGNNNLSRMSSCLDAAHHFALSRADAHAHFMMLKTAIETYWHHVCDEAELSQVDRESLWNRQFINPFSLE